MRGCIAVRAYCASVGTDYEIVLVNDGSCDQTWMRRVLLAKRDLHVVAVKSLAQVWPSVRYELAARFAGKAKYPLSKVVLRP